MDAAIFMGMMCSMNIRALNYDLARSRRADLPHLKAIVDQLAEHGFNMLSLYLEHRFDYPSCPGVAPPGSLTPAMARELHDYARARGVEVIPQINLLGHCEGIGATERYAHLTCDPFQQEPWGGYEQLNLGLEETRDFVRSAIGDICDAFPGTYVHIGGDEVRQMAWLFPEDAARQQETMAAWLMFIIEDVRRHGRQVLLWGDMLLHHESVMQGMPRDLIICDWQYGPLGSRETLERFKAEGFKVLAAPCVATCPGFGVNGPGSLRNIGAMVGDTMALDLEGFLLTTWEFGFGSGPGQIWPFVAYAGALAAGEQIADGDAFVASFANQRYGVDGDAVLRLQAILSSGLEAALMQDLAKRPKLLLVSLRKALFRGAPPFPHIARPTPAPPNGHRPVWEPGPFGCWLFLRPILTPALLERLTTLAAEGESLAAHLRREATRHADELEALFGLAEGLAVMVEGLMLLQEAKTCYHGACLIQRDHADRFREALMQTSDRLERLKPGLDRLKALVERSDRAYGLDAGEHDWLAVQEKSLREHIDALRRYDPASDSLLEFGEFLRRPAHVRQRLTWR